MNIFAQKNRRPSFIDHAKRIAQEQGPADATGAEPAEQVTLSSETSTFSAFKPTKKKVVTAAKAVPAVAALAGAAYVVGQMTDPLIGTAVSTVLGAGGAAIIASKSGGDVSRAALGGASTGLYTGMLMTSPDMSFADPLVRGGLCIATGAGAAYLA